MAPEITVEGDTFYESDSHVIFSLTRSGSLSIPSQVNYSITANGGDGQAHGTEDFDNALLSGQVNFAVNETEKTVELPLLDDDINEPLEAVHINLSNPQNATLSQAAAVGYIIDNDDPEINFTVVSKRVVEGAGTIPVEVVLNGEAITEKVSVDYRLSLNADETDVATGTTTGTLTFEPGQIRLLSKLKSWKTKYLWKRTNMSISYLKILLQGQFRSLRRIFDVLPLRIMMLQPPQGLK